MDFLPKNSSDRLRLSIFISALFFLMAIGMLLHTFHLSDQVKENATNINLAGRQRMLSQRIVKSLLLLKLQNTPEERAAAKNELTNAFNLFDRTLEGFAHGGKTQDSQLQTITISALESPKEKVLLAETLKLWKPYKEAILNLIENDVDIHPTDWDAALAIAITSNQSILVLMNNLTMDLELSSKSKSNELRLLQNLLMGLASISFVIVLILIQHEISLTNRHRELLNRVIHQLHVGILIHNDQNIIIGANDTARKLFGYDNIDEMVGKAHYHLLYERDNDTYGRRKEGTTFLVQTHQCDVTLDEEVVKLNAISDITMQRAMEESLNKLAYYDTLTGLPNRLLFDDRMHQGIIAAKRYGTKLALLFVDLNKFKLVNDTYGHHIGDLLLKEIAYRLSRELREEDTVSRIGGDEFVVIINTISSMEDCEKVIIKLLQALRAPFVMHGVAFHPDASIGACLFPDFDENELLINADQAMYEAKRDSDKHYAFYSDTQSGFSI